jgi:hypothetical protein
MRKGLDRALPLKVSEKNFFVGFYHAVKVELRDERTGRSPTPQSVYKVLRDERPSAKLLKRIFEKCPDLLKHPATSDAVKKLYLDWLTNGNRLPEEYARGGRTLAKECAQ